MICNEIAREKKRIFFARVNIKFLITEKIQKEMKVKALFVHGVVTYQLILALQWLQMMTVPWSFTP